MSDTSPRAEEGAAIFHRAMQAVSAVEGTIGVGMALVGGLLVTLALAQFGFHREAVRRHRAAQKEGE